MGFLLAYRLTCFVYLDLLFVHPSHRRQGVGRVLLDRMSEELRGLPLELCCDVTDGELLGWLGRYGFRHITPEPSVASWMYKPTRGG